ncbi:ABC transporter permease [Candidatus Mycoplasma mahonii]|uniref:ABC transporter permease n=1 Tax=Candidatus Mycoplasma mahonii TaxID=3004105 RepID=UPI0026F0D715|nr:ABC transporter permease [Candidatus Mycoplasma mahonii]WKX02339.1 ABC transporter permease [Candidatus Mycoplasma mahonii]
MVNNTKRNNFNLKYNLDNFNKKWFDELSKKDVSKIESNPMIGKPTKVWKDIFRRFFKNKWNIFFLLMLMVLMVIIIFGQTFNSYNAENPINDRPNNLIAYMDPGFANKPSDLIGNFSEIQDRFQNIEVFNDPTGTATIVASGTNSPPAGIISSSYNPISSIWTIKYNDPNYTPTTLGTDAAGFDVWQRLIKSAQFSFFLAFIVAVIETIIGTIIGLYLGYNAGKRADTIFMRFVEIFASLPAILLISVFIIIMGPGLLTLVVALSLIGWIGPVYTTRMFTIKIKDNEFIQASIASGSSVKWLLFSQILPATIGKLLVSFVHRIPAVIFTESTLVFLGIRVGGKWGNSLGSFINEARQYEAIVSNPYMIISMVIVMVTFTLSLQIIANGLRDAFDPKTT